MIHKFAYYDADRQLSAHFNSREFRCHCGCRHALIDERLVTALELLRIAINEPLRVTSGYRCPAHNKATPGSAWNSRHKKGDAADVAAEIPFPGIKGELASAANALAGYAKALRLDNGSPAFRRIGIYDARFFVHLGVAGFGFKTWRKKK